LSTPGHRMWMSKSRFPSGQAPGQILAQALGQAPAQALHLR